MLLAEQRYTLNGKEILLRSARIDEAQMLIDYLKTVTGETRDNTAIIQWIGV